MKYTRPQQSPGRRRAARADGAAELRLHSPRRRLRALLAALADAGAQGPPLAFVTISLDPAHDTPALLRS